MRFSRIPFFVKKAGAPRNPCHGHLIFSHLLGRLSAIAEGDRSLEEEAEDPAAWEAHSGAAPSAEGVHILAPPFLEAAHISAVRVVEEAHIAVPGVAWVPGEVSFPPEGANRPAAIGCHRFAAASSVFFRLRGPNPRSRWRDIHSGALSAFLQQA